jgi:urease accessory protein
MENRENLMLCDRIVTHSSDTDAMPDVAADDDLDVDWWELDRRAFRKTTRAGRDVRVLLSLGMRLRHGDLLTDADGRVHIEVCVAPCELLIVRPRNLTEMGLLTLEIGNLHIPAEIIDGTCRLPINGPAEAAIARLGLPCSREHGRLQPIPCLGMPELRISPALHITRA